MGLLLISCAGASGSTGGTGGATSGSAPDFSLQDLDGNEFTLSEHVGRRVVLLNFWATWCDPCLVEMPHLDRMSRDYGDAGLQVVCIAIDGPDTVADVRSEIRRHDYSFTVLLDTETEVKSLYNPRGDAPFSVLIDRSGSIVWSREGYRPGHMQELEDRLRELLAPAEG